MKTYVFDRIGVLILMLFGYLWTVQQWSGDEYAQWSVILAVVTLAGYTHFIIGAFYQWRSFERTKNPILRKKWFFLLALFSVIVCVPFIAYEQLGYLSLVSIGYFLLHGFFNEITLYEKVVEAKANHWTVAALVTFLFGMMMLSVGHPSSLFNEFYEFFKVDAFTARFMIEQSAVVSFAKLFGEVLLYVAVGFQLLAIRTAKKYKLVNVCILLLFVGGATFLPGFHPLTYVLMLAGLLLYHFLIWFWFYFRAFRLRPGNGLRNYLLTHAVVLAPFLLLLTSGKASEYFGSLFYNSYTFLIFTTIHISTSFLSEGWFMKLISKE